MTEYRDEKVECNVIGKKKEIQMAFELVEKITEKLFNQVEDLSGRLLPVLSSSCQKSGVDEELPRPDASLANDLISHVNRISEIVDRCDDILERLEL